MRKYGSGPAGAQSVDIAYLSIRLPERIVENISNDNRLSAVHGGPTRSRLRSDGKAVDGLGVGLGKAWGGAVPHVLPVLMEEQDGAKQAGKLRFHNPHQLLQYFLHRGITRDHLQNTALSFTQRLCPLALGDIDHRTNKFNEISGRTEDWVAYRLDLPDLAAGMNDSVIKLESCLFSACVFELIHCPGLIIGVNVLKKCFDSRQLVPRIKTQQAVAFLGPVPELSRSRSSSPTACVAEPLRFREIVLAQAQRPFRPLALGDVRHRSRELDASRFINQGASHSMDIFDRTIRHQQAIFMVKIFPIVRRALEGLLHEGRVFRVNPLQDQF